jgi:hypothetical protein
MKKTSFLFATLTALAFLSCSTDNSTSAFEDVNYPQTLQKVVPPGDEVQQTCYSETYTASKTMGIVIYNPGQTANSFELEFPEPSTLPKNAVLTNVQVNTGSSITYTGAVLTNYLIIRKLTSNTPPAQIPWGGAVNTLLTTNAFNGELARDKYYVSFNATCVGFGTANICSKSYSKVKLILHYCVQ